MARRTPAPRSPAPRSPARAALLPAGGGRRNRSRLVPFALAVSVLAASAAIASCVSGSAVPSDPKLAQGQEVYNMNCVACHGSGGGGGTGPRLIGIGDRMTEEQEIAKITDGVSGTAMPAWGGRLSEEEIAAVAAYTRSLTAPS